MMLTAALLGAFHGINPAMGWLFAVFLALQRKRRAELFHAMLPIAVGHGLSVALVVAIVALAGSTLPIQPVRYVGAAVVLCFGLYRLFRWYRHLSWGSLKMSGWELAVWSFLGATSHGSGLMLTPLVLNGPGGANAAAMVLVHTVVMLSTMAGVAVLVHDRMALAALRKYWVNFDLLWAAGLVVAGGILLIGAATHSHV